MKTWDGQVAALAARYQVVLLDLAGHGESGKGRKDYTIQAFGQDVRAVCDALGLKKVILVGHSMGGPVILEAALLMPDRVAGLVPVDTLLDADSEMPADKKQAFFRHMHEDFKGAVAGFLPHLFPPNADKALIDRVVTMETSNDPQMMVPLLETLWAYDEKTGLARVKVPIRAVNADLFHTSVEHNRKYAPQFDAVIMTGVGHWLMLERPDEFNAKLLGVIDGMKTQ